MQKSSYPTTSIEMRIVESYYCQFQNTFWLFLMSYLLIFQSLVVKIGKLFVPEQGEHKKFLHTSLTKHRTSKIFSYRLSRNFHKIHSIWIQTLTQPTFCTFVAQIHSFYFYLCWKLLQFCVSNHFDNKRVSEILCFSFTLFFSSFIYL